MRAMQKSGLPEFRRGDSLGRMYPRLWNRCSQACEKVYDLLYPPRCGFCGLNAGHVCGACRDELAWNLSACECCAAELGLSEVCGACTARPPPWSRAYVPLRYAFPLDCAIKRFKFHGAQHYLPVFADLLLPVCEQLPRDIDLLQPMPLHWRRQALRGFNQATELARPIARQLRLPIADAVRRVRYTPPQSSLPSSERRRSLDGCFRARQRLPGGHVLIVDDVMTTGASVAALSRCLLKAGARQVSVLALAHSSLKRRL